MSGECIAYAILGCMYQQAYAIEAEAEVGIIIARAKLERECGPLPKNHPDIVVLRYNLFSVEDARRVGEIALRTPVEREAMTVIIAASRAYHEAQNALLKLFEEPPLGMRLFLVLPTLGGLLPTLRSRLQIIKNDSSAAKPFTDTVQDFLNATKAKRSILIKKLINGKDDDERRTGRDKAIAILDGVEMVAYAAWHRSGSEYAAALLADSALLRGYLHDRNAPIRMILEHLSIAMSEGDFLQHGVPSTDLL